MTIIINTLITCFRCSLASQSTLMMLFNVNMCVIHIINTRKHKNSEFVCTELINSFCGATVT